MGKYFVKLPKMGESVVEATVTAWLKDVGDSILIDDTIVEVATDKVDSEIQSEVEGVLIEKRFDINDVVSVGTVIGVIETEGDNELEDDVEDESNVAEDKNVVLDPPVENPVEVIENDIATTQKSIQPPTISNNTSKRFYSPLVKNIAKEESISNEELDTIAGSGEKGRVTKNDILAYIKTRNTASTNFEKTIPNVVTSTSKKIDTVKPTPSFKSQPIAVSSQDQVIEMSRMGKMISDNMLNSKKVSAHVQSFVEVDVTNLWDWRERVKHNFQKKEQEKLTFTPLFVAAVVKAIKAFPLLNSSVDGSKIIQKRAINIGMATALGDGNLIVPVIKNADHLNLVGLAKAVNSLALRARDNKLLPDEVQGGTYTITNLGNFGSITGTPIINQPQVGILALGIIRKMPSVIETPNGDFIGIRRKMILSHSYDHRIINGAMGGEFVKKVADALENWDTSIDF